jgi:siroheme decarboxylase
MRKISELDKKIIRQIQGDIPLSVIPFSILARKIGLPEKKVIERIHGFMKRGMIRRFGAILYHQKSGYRGNAMIAWKVPENQLFRAGKIMASFLEVSHCYCRFSHPRWPFNLYTMIHGRNASDCRRSAWKISRETGIENYEVLFSKLEYRKSSMSYF